MGNDPLGTFGVLWSLCVRDDNDGNPSLFTATAASFALGVVASVVTAYFIGLAHLVI